MNHFLWVVLNMLLTLEKCFCGHVSGIPLVGGREVNFLFASRFGMGRQGPYLLGLNSHKLGSFVGVFS